MRKAILALALTAFVAVGASATEDATTPGIPSALDGSFPILGEIALDEALLGGSADYCVGVGFDGDNFWVSSGDQGTGTCMFSIIDEFGNLVDQVPQGAGASGWGHRDLCWDGTYMYGSFSTMVNAFAGDYQYFNFFIGYHNPNRAQAWDGSYFYTANFSDPLTRMEFTAWGAPATCTPLASFDGVYGAAYEGGEDILYLTSANYTGDLYTCTTDGFPLNVYTCMPEYDIQGGCTMACISLGDVLCVLQQFSPDMLTFYDIGAGPSPVDASSWGTIKAMFR